MNRPIVSWEPFPPVAALERRVEELESLNQALREDVTAACDQVAIKCGVIAGLEQELAQLKAQQRVGEYRFARATTEGSGRFRVQEGR